MKAKIKLSLINSFILTWYFIRFIKAETLSNSVSDWLNTLIIFKLIEIKIISKNKYLKENSEISSKRLHDMFWTFEWIMYTDTKRLESTIINYAINVKHRILLAVLTLPSNWGNCRCVKSLKDLTAGVLVCKNIYRWQIKCFQLYISFWLCTSFIRLHLQCFHRLKKYP